MYMTNPICLFIFLIMTGTGSCLAQVKQEPIPSDGPNIYQQEQIKRKYGMFIHFGINTFYDEEWTDGS